MRTLGRILPCSRLPRGEGSFLVERVGSCQLNGTELGAEEDGTLPDLQGAWQEGVGIPMVTVSPLSHAFVMFPAH